MDCMVPQICSLFEVTATFKMSTATKHSTEFGKINITHFIFNTDIAYLQKDCQKDIGVAL